MSVHSAAVRQIEKVKTLDADAPAIDVLSMVREAVDRSGLKQEGIADDVGYKPDYWSRVLSGERGVTLERLGRLPLEVQRELVTAWAWALGLRVERRRADRHREMLEALSMAAKALAEGL
jgi:hypothetical protein